MTISEYIAALEAIKKEHGDLRVMTYCYGAVKEAPLPEMREIREKNPRERNTHYLYDHEKGLYKAIEKVCNI